VTLGLVELCLSRLFPAQWVQSGYTRCSTTDASAIELGRAGEGSGVRLRPGLPEYRSSECGATAYVEVLHFASAVTVHLRCGRVVKCVQDRATAAGSQQYDVLAVVGAGERRWSRCARWSKPALRQFGVLEPINGEPQETSSNGAMAPFLDPTGRTYGATVLDPPERLHLGFAALASTPTGKCLPRSGSSLPQRPCHS